jgi:hypothetical protein
MPRFMSVETRALFSELAPSVSVENMRGQLGHHHHRAMKEHCVVGTEFASHYNAVSHATG